MARVSVLIPAHNRLDYLPQTLASVYAQTHRDFEVVLVDDGSSDGTREWVRSRRFPRLRCLRTEENRGPAAARNLALSSARGDFIAFLDSDDLWAPGYLSAMLGCFASRETLAACCDISVIDSAGRVIRRDFYRAYPKGREPRFERLSGLRCCPTLTSSLLRRGVFTAVGGFDEGFKRLHDDRDLFYRIARRFGPPAFYFLPRNMAYYRRHEGQITDFVERGEGYMPSSRRLSRWREISSHEREIVLDMMYFSSKHDCRHCDGARVKPRKSRTAAPASSTCSRAA